ncbi:MAG TPA: choice-of-anchor D domain-containing protein [Casimicrobiaceae bacterium]|jgi:hypothetical protein|nr:choice-of-anchor D domain-containing protein [Casimicrobiaceae bacterium]
MTRVRLFCLSLLPLLMAWSVIVYAQTGNVANGKTTYATWCVGCHNANPTKDAHGIINGAGNPNFILNEWSIVPAMQFLLQGALPDPVQSAADVAAYLATLTGGGGGGQGNLQVPGSVSLGSQTVGTQSGAVAVTITNVGNASVTVSSISDGNGAEFPLVSQTCTTAALAAGASCQLSIVFVPAATGGRNSTFTVSSNGTGSPQTLVASGTGTNVVATPGQLQVVPAVNFGSQNVGSASTPAPVVIANSGGTAVTISSAASNDSEYPITSSSCTGSVAPGANCVLNVAFSPISAGAHAATITVVSSGLGSPQTIALSGTGVQPTGGGPTAQAVEYYYAAWNFYFETAFPAEIAALDGGAFGGLWQRTGQTFNVWPQSNPAAAPTCRFFSTAFAPKSSHFYTPFAAECATLMTSPAWQYEAIAFYIALADVNGLCASGTVPLYRLYNNGMGGAPNHRYTTDPAIFNQMRAAGWLFEGNGNTKVFACVPQ